MKRLVLALLVVGAVTTPAVPTAAHAEPRMRLTSSPDRLVLNPTTGEPARDTLQLTVETTVPATVTVTYSDVVLGEGDQLTKVDARSTGYSMADFLTITPATTMLSPSKQPQTLPVTVEVSAKAGTQARVGVLTATLNRATSGAGSDDTVGLAQGVAIDTTILTSADSAFTARAHPALASRGLTYQAAGPRSWLDSVIPDLPGLLDAGPVTASEKVLNDGDVVLDTQSVFEFARVGAWSVFDGPDAGTVVYRWKANHRVSLPDQTVASTSSSLMTIEGVTDRPDALPWFGFVRISANTTGALGSITTPAVHDSVLLLVAPWKEALVVLLALGVWLLVRRRRRRRRPPRPVPEPAPARVPAVRGQHRAP